MQLINKSIFLKLLKNLPKLIKTLFLLIRLLVLKINSMQDERHQEVLVCLQKKNACHLRLPCQRLAPSRCYCKLLYCKADANLEQSRLRRHTPLQAYFLNLLTCVSRLAKTLCAERRRHMSS